MEDDLIAAQLELSATDEASPVLERLGATGETVADRLEAVGPRVTASWNGMLSEISATSSRLEATFSALAGGSSRVEGGFGAAGTSARSLADDFSAARDSASLLDQQLRETAAGAQETKGGLLSVGEEAEYTANQLAKTTGGLADIDRVLVRFEASLSAVSDMADSVVVSLERLDGGLQTTSDEAEQAAGSLLNLGSDSDTAAGQIDILTEATDRYAAAQERANTAARQGAGTAGHSGAAGGFSSYSLERGSRNALVGGAGLLALPVGGLIEEARFLGAGQATAGNANLSTLIQTALDAYIKKLFGSGPIGYKDLFGAEQRTAETFPQPAGMSNAQYEKELEAIIESSWKSAIGSHGSITTISGALALAMHNWGLAPGQAPKAMDVLHSIAAYAGGGTTVETLSQNMGKSSSLAAILGISMPDWGALFDVIAKQFGPSRTDTYLAGLEQKVLAQTPAAHKALDTLGLNNEWNAAGLQQFGIFKLLTDLQSALQTVPKDSRGSLLQSILPSVRGGQAFMALDKGTHLSEAEHLATRLGGSLGPGGPITGTGGDIGGVTNSMFDRMMNQLITKLDTAWHKVESFAMGLSGALAPAVTAVVNDFGPFMDGLEHFLTQNPGVVKGVVDLGGVLLGAGVAMKGLQVAELLTNPLIGGAAAAVLLYTNVKPVHDEVDRLAKDSLPYLKTGLRDVETFLQNFSKDFVSAFSHTKEYSTDLHTIGSALSEIGNAITPVLGDLGLLDKNSKAGADSASGLAHVLNDVLLLAVRGVATQIKTWADTTVFAVDTVRTVVKTGGEVITGIFDSLAHAPQTVEQQWHQFQDWSGQTWRTIASVVGTAKNDLLGHLHDLGTGTQSVLTGTISDVTTWGGNLKSGAQSAVSGFVSTVETGLTSTLSKISAFIGTSLATIGGWASKMTSEGATMITNLADGITSDADKLTSALKSAVKDALDAALTEVKQHNPFDWLKSHMPSFSLGPIGVGGKSGGGPIGYSGAGAGGGYVAGSQYGSYGGYSANYASSGDVAMLGSLGVPNSGGIMDTDFPAAAGTPYRLPPGGSYTLVSQGEDPNVGGYEVWKNTKNGGTLMFLHGQPTSGGNPSPFATGSTVAGGTYVGKSGHALTTAYGNDPSFYHLCVVTDSGERIWLSESQMAALAGGGQRGGGFAITRPGGGTATIPSVYNPASGPYHMAPGTAAAFATDPVTTSAYNEFISGVKQLPSDLRGYLAPTAQGFQAAETKLDTTYAKTRAADIAAYDKRVQSIQGSYQHAAGNILSSAQEIRVEHIAGHQVTMDAETQRAVVSAAAASRSDATSRSRILANEQDAVHAAQTNKATPKEIAAIRAKYDRQLSALDAKGNGSISTAEARLGITSAEGQKKFELWLSHQQFSTDQKLGNAKYSENKQLATAYNDYFGPKGIITRLDQGHVSDVGALAKQMRGAMSPEEIWNNLTSGIQKALSKGTSSLDAALLEGVSKIGPFVSEIVNATVANQKLTVIKSREAEITERKLAGDQKYIDLQAQQQRVDAQTSMYKEEEALGVSKINLENSSYQATLARTTILSEQQNAVSAQQQVVQDAILSSSKQYVSALISQKQSAISSSEIESSTALKVDAAMSDFGQAATDAGTLLTDYEQRWTQAVAAGQPVMNSFVVGMREAYDAQQKNITAQNVQSVVVGTLVGSFQMLSQGLQGLFGQAKDAISFWATTIGTAAHTTGGTIVQLGSNALTAAQNLSTAGEIIQGFTDMVSQYTDAATYSIMRTGTIDPGIIAEYGASQQKLTTANWDQVSANLQLAQSTGDLNGYLTAVGQEINLWQAKLVQDAAVYGPHSAQVQKDQQVLTQLTTEQTNLGNELKILTDTSGNAAQTLNLTDQQIADAGTAFGVFQSKGIDPAQAALVGLAQTLPQTAQSASQAFTDAGSASTTLAGDLGTLDGAVNSLAGVIDDAIARINGATGSISPGLQTNAPPNNAATAGRYTLPQAGAGSGTTSGTSAGSTGGYSSIYNAAPTLVSQHKVVSPDGTEHWVYTWSDGTTTYDQPYPTNAGGYQIVGTGSNTGSSAIVYTQPATSTTTAPSTTISPTTSTTTATPTDSVLAQYNAQHPIGQSFGSGISLGNGWYYMGVGKDGSAEYAYTDPYTLQSTFYSSSTPYTGPASFSPSGLTPVDLASVIGPVSSLASSGGGSSSPYASGTDTHTSTPFSVSTAVPLGSSSSTPVPVTVTGQAAQDLTKIASNTAANQFDPVATAKALKSMFQQVLKIDAVLGQGRMPDATTAGIDAVIDRIGQYSLAAGQT